MNDNNPIAILTAMQLQRGQNQFTENNQDNTITTMTTPTATTTTRTTNNNYNNNKHYNNNQTTAPTANTITNSFSCIIYNFVALFIFRTFSKLFFGLVLALTCIYYILHFLGFFTF